MQRIVSLAVVLLVAIGCAPTSDSEQALTAGGSNVGMGGNAGGPSVGQGGGAGGPSVGGGGLGGPSVGLGGSGSGPSVGFPGGGGQVTGTPTGGGSLDFASIAPTCNTLLQAWVNDGIAGSAPSSLATNQTQCISDLQTYGQLLSADSSFDPAANPLIGSDGQGNICQRDADVVGAILGCLGTYCDSLDIGPLVQAGVCSDASSCGTYLASTYVQPAEQNLCSALALCGNAPCFSAGPNCPVPCPTAQSIFTCPSGNGLTCP